MKKTIEEEERKLTREEVFFECIIEEMEAEMKKMLMEDLVLFTALREGVEEEIKKGRVQQNAQQIKKRRHSDEIAPTEIGTDTDRQATLASA